MNRIEYMRRLAALLQDVPVKERVAAMQYYNDYFDDAGEENEGQVIEELGSPEQVAAEMKAGLEKQSEESGEFRETGYTDTQFERKDMPAAYRKPGAGQAADFGRQPEPGQGGNAYQQRAGQTGNAYRQPGTDQTGNPYQQPDSGQTGNPYGQQRTGQDGNSYQNEYQRPANKPWTSSGLKLALIILILLMVVPVAGPVLIAVVAVLFALVIASFAIFVALVAVAAVLAVAGVAVFVRGAFMIVTNTAVALAAMGTGLILAVVGVVAVVAAVRLCIIVLPGLFRFFVNLCRKPFQRRKERR